MAELVVIVPSRGRPDAAAALARQFAATCTDATELVFAVDADDPQLDGYRGLRSGLGPHQRARVHVVPDPSTMVHALNQAALAILEDAPFAVGFLGDDHFPRSRGWDTAYLTALSELGTGIVYGNDLLQGSRLPTQCAMTADIVRTLGYMAPPVLRHMYVDNWWLDLGKTAQCLRYLPDVIVEHRHPLAGKAPWDDGYRRVNASDVFDADAVAYEAWAGDHLSNAARVVEALR